MNWGDIFLIQTLKTKKISKIFFDLFFVIDVKSRYVYIIAQAEAISAYQFIHDAELLRSH